MPNTSSPLGNGGTQPEKREDNAAPATPPVRERLLKPEEVAEWLQVERSWVLRHSKPNSPEPKIPSVRLGLELRFRSSDVEQWIAQQFENGHHKKKGK